MNAPVYNLRQAAPGVDSYLEVVRELTGWVLSAGEALHPVVDAYGEFVELNGIEQRRSQPEYLLEALTLGVLWRARGNELRKPTLLRKDLITELVRERRAGAEKRRDGSVAELVTPGSAKRGRIDPTLSEIEQLLDWMLATGEYDDEYDRLCGWQKLLASSQPATSREILRLIVAFAVRFESIADRMLGAFTRGVGPFLQALEGTSEDVVQRSRRPVEYHLNMVGAEMLNRAWRKGFLACQRILVVLPGCTRARADSACRAKRSQSELTCSHCTLGCSVSATTRLAERTGAETVAVLHGSDFSSFLKSESLSGSSIGIVGVACASGLIGAGWRVRAKGFEAQCVLLNAPGCNHWRTDTSPTAFDQAELSRILDRTDGEVTLAAPRVA